MEYAKFLNLGNILFSGLLPLFGLFSIKGLAICSCFEIYIDSSYWHIYSNPWSPQVQIRR